jgi:cytochrome P450
VATASFDIPPHVPRDRVRDVDMYALEGIEQGPHQAWMRLRPAGTPGLIWTPRSGGHWIATRGTLIKEIYSDYQRFSSEVFIIPKDVGSETGFLPLALAPPDHTPYRRAIDKIMNLAQVRKLEARVREISAELIDRFVAKGGCDFAADYAQQFPVRVFMALAGLPVEDIPELLSYAHRMTRPEGDTPEEVAADLAAGNNGFLAYADKVIRARRGKGGTDLMSMIADAELNGQPMPVEESVSVSCAMLLGGLDTVVNFLSLVMLHLAQHPENVEELKSDPLVLMRGVEELFRRFPVSAVARMVASDFEYDGVELKQGEMILLPGVFHALDEEETSHPMEVDFSRKSFSHSMFGHGPHRCAGLHLARMETIITLQEWLKRIPAFRLREGTTPHYRSGMLAYVENLQLAWDVA